MSIPTVKPVDEMPLDLFMGKAVCLDLRHIPDLGEITLAHMEEAEKKAGVKVDGHIVLLCTGFHKRTYPGLDSVWKNPQLTVEATQWMYDRGSRMHGVEGPSTDRPSDNIFSQHRLCRKLGISHWEWLVNLEELLGQRRVSVLRRAIEIQGWLGLAGARFRDRQRLTPGHAAYSGAALMSADFDAMSAAELRRRVAAKDVSPVELTRRALAKAEATQATLNAFFVLLPERALAAAKAAEDAVMRGEPLGLLHGVPFSAKDLMAVADVRYASGSRTMANNIAAVDAPAVERAKAAGAILIGKTTTSEFGCKPVGDSPLTGITRHPWNLEKTPGGSSAGAAASVAAGITPFALGTDGGGSVRIPCCFTGLAGIKAHFGRVPVWPASATPTLAHVGAIARNVGDAALLISAIGGYDAARSVQRVGGNARFARRLQRRCCRSAHRLQPDTWLRPARSGCPGGRGGCSARV